MTTVLNSCPTVADHHKRCKQIRDEVVAAGYKPKKMFVFLLNTAQFEFLLKEVITFVVFYNLVMFVVVYSVVVFLLLFTIL